MTSACLSPACSTSDDGITLDAISISERYFVNSPGVLISANSPFGIAFWRVQPGVLPDVKGREPCLPTPPHDDARTFSWTPVHAWLRTTRVFLEPRTLLQLIKSLPPLASCYENRHNCWWGKPVCGRGCEDSGNCVSWYLCQERADPAAWGLSPETNLQDTCLGVQFSFSMECVCVCMVGGPWTVQINSFPGREWASEPVCLPARVCGWGEKEGKQSLEMLNCWEMKSYPEFIISCTEDTREVESSFWE